MLPFLQDVQHGISRVHGACDVLATCGKFNGLCFVYGVLRLEYHTG